VDTLRRDLQYSLRVLRRERGFTALAVLTICLGIGATSAIFAVVESVLLRPLPYTDPGRLVVVLHGPDATSPVSPADYADYRSDARSFESMAAAQAWGVTLGGGDRPERVDALQVSAGLFDVLGVPAMLGRTFSAGEDHAGRDQLVVLSHGLWQRRFGADPDIVGRSIAVDGRPRTVVGVMPADFRFAPFWQTRAELWAPLSLDTRRDDRDGRSLRVFARLAPGVSVAQAQQEVSRIAGRLEHDYPRTNTGLSITVRPLMDKVVAGIRGTLVALLAMVVFVLLIACTNVSSAMLARASARRQEIALRLAIGARPSGIIRQQLTESVLLALAGATAGLALAHWSVSWLLTTLPPGTLPRQQDVGFDGWVYAAATLAALVTAVVTGLMPALQVLRPSLTTAFAGAKGATEGVERKRTRSILIAAEVALALILLVGAGLMARTMLALSAVRPGFSVESVAVATVSLAGTPHAAPDARHAAYDRVAERLAALPGVRSVSAINHLPLAGDVWTLGYTIDGRPAPDPGHRWAAVYRVVRPGYFSTMGIPIEAGRDFITSDGASAAPVAIVNRAMADHRWPGQSAVGQRLHLPGPGNVQDPITIVGVVGSVRQGDWTSTPADEIYVAFDQRAPEFGLTSLTFVMRTSVPAARVASAVTAAIAEVDRSVPVSNASTMASVVADELWREKLTARLSGAFAVVALVLAAIGIYAAVSYSVQRRTREFGVRMALGGTPRQLQALAMRDGLLPVAFGLVAGGAAATGAVRLIRTLLFGVDATDVPSFAAAIGTLVVVSSCAAWLPARRASTADPAITLRAEG
jgi:putative ABC transport system permease protein